MSEFDNTIELVGKVVHVVFRNEQTFYTVMRIKTTDEREKTITATGILPHFDIDVEYTFNGNYVEHPRYGLQFQIQWIKKALPNGTDGVVRYLSGIRFPGIGKKTAERIVETLGEHCLEDIRENPELLYRVEGMKRDKVNTIIEGLRQDDESMDELVRFLNVHGIGMRNLIRLNRTYGHEALAKIRENPYRVIEECDGFGFKTADAMAKSLGIEDDDERRLYALLVSLCMDLCMSSGDSYVTLSHLEERFAKACKNLDYDFNDLLVTAEMRRTLVREEEKVYPVSQYDAEMTISNFLTDQHWPLIPPPDEDILDSYLSQMEESLSIDYDEDQKKAIKTLFEVPFMIMTGGPGTGKTTVVRAMTELQRLLYPGSTILCTAPTGRAAKRLSEITESHSITIHSLLKWDLETNSFGKDEDDPIQADLLIVDEFSMVDPYLFAHLLKASGSIGRICIIGDEDQLPSVSPGSVLRDLIASDIFPLIRLSHIHRQKEGSDVIALAHDIRIQDVQFDRYTNDVAFIENDVIPLRQQVLSVVRSALDKGYSMNDVQVLSPIYNGNAGIDLLNNALQEAFNPPDSHKREVKSGYMTFRVGDKILQLKNQPDDDVYNGDIGILEEIALPSETENHMTVLVVNFDGIYVEYVPENFRNITLAYCISIHKSQGSEYPIVIMPMTSSQQFMLQRNLIYTGITRARQSLLLLGERKAFFKGIETLDRHIRLTTLKEKLLEAQRDPFFDDFM